MATSAPREDTESPHPRGEELDQASIFDVVAWLHEEDAAAVMAVEKVLPVVADVAQKAADALRKGGRLIYVGAGTSGRLAGVDAAECPPTFGTSPSQVVAVMAGGEKAFFQAIEGAEDDAQQGQKELEALKVTPLDLVVGISASGQAPFVLGALAHARKVGAPTVMVACTKKALESRMADVLVVAETGAELLAGSTRLKAGTATKLILNAISTAAMVSLGKVFRGRMVDMAPTNRKLRERAVRMLMDLAEVSETEAQVLLAQAEGSPKLALAMYFTGLDKARASEMLETRTLRELSKAKVQ